MSDQWGPRKETIEGEYEVIDERDAGEVYQAPGTGRYLEMDPLPPYVTYLLLGVNIAAWLLMSLMGMLFGLSLNEQLLLFGAKVNQLVAQGQYWRLFTAMFLHIGIMHLFFNSYALYIYGPVVEKLFGKKKFLVVYLLSGLMGSLFSYLFSRNPAAGASGAIFGLMGALLYFRQRKRDIFQRVFGAGLMMIIGINLFYGFVQPGIDNWGHIGGLVGGFLLANAVGLYKESIASGKRVLVWILIVVLWTGGLWYGQQIHGRASAINMAIQSLRAGDLDAAEGYAVKAARQSTDQEVHQVLEAVLITKTENHLTNGAYEDALGSISTLISFYPDDIRYYLFRASIYEGTGADDPALQDYLRILDMQDQNGQVWYLAGRSAYRLGRAAEAREYLTQAVMLMPGHEEAADLLRQLDHSL